MFWYWIMWNCSEKNGAVVIQEEGLNWITTTLYIHAAFAIEKYIE